MSQTASALRGAWALLLSLAHLGASVAYPAVDAVLEAKAAQESVHIEGPSTECATHHDQVYCQTVRSLSAQYSATVPSVPVEDARALFERRPAPASAPVVASRWVGPVGPRAPPSV